MVVDILLLLICMALGGGLYLLVRRMRELRSDVDRLRQYNLRQARQLKTLEDQSEIERAAQYVAQWQAHGRLRITENMSLAEACGQHKEVPRILAVFGLGPVDGGAPPDEHRTIREAARAQHINPVLILHALNHLFNEHDPNADGPLRIMG